MTGAPKVPMPSGTVTFLFTDIEGSTQRWDRDRAAMQAALRVHDGILRDAIAAHDGSVFKTIGDAFCAAFATPEAAAEAALDAQRELAAADFSSVGGLNIRAAIHTGTADERDGDYFGPTVNRVARLLSVAHGGQVLLTAVAAQLLREHLTQQMTLTELGPHTLKDLKDEEHVHQLHAPGLQREFPELRAQKTEAPWLVPEAMRTRYFTGREELLDRLHAQLTERGRAALCGLGGAGKTQAAMEYASRHRSSYPAGVFWVNAETVGGLIAGFVAIAGALRLGGASTNDHAHAVPAVLEWFGRVEGWLLIFDNVDERRDLQPFVPKRGKGNVLITSREPVFQELGIPRALEVPDLANDAAVRFLLARTDREDADPAELTAASKLATELGNLPLALEQAAAYITETAASFASYLQAFRKRHVALLEKAVGLVSRDTVAVTWAANFAAVERSSPGSADALRLSAFLAPDVIPFELFENEADDDEMASVELLRPLARYSLIRADPVARAFGVHRLVQEVVRAALGDAGSRTYLDRAVSALNAAFPDASFSLWARSDRLTPHAVAVASWANAFDVQPAAIAELLTKAGRHLTQRGRYNEAEVLSRQALAFARKMHESDHLEIAAALANLANVAQRQGRYAEAEPLFEQILAVRERLLGPEHRAVAITLLNFGNVALNVGDYTKAQARYERAIAIATANFGEDHEFVGTALNNIARVYEKTGRYDEAQQLDERAMDIRERTLGADHPHVALSCEMLGNDIARHGDFAQAEALHKRALAIRERALGPDHDEVAESLNSLAALYLKQGRDAEARPLYERALSIGERALAPGHSTVADILDGLARLHLKNGDYDAAAPLFERSLAMRENALGPEHPDLAATLLGLAALETERGKLGEASAHVQRALGIKERVFAPGHPELAELRAALREHQA